MFGFCNCLVFQLLKQVIINAVESPLFKESGLQAVTQANNFVDFLRSAYKKCLKRFFF